MKIIITEEQYFLLNEMITIDIKVGDTILGGKFKNKKIIVKRIEKNDYNKIWMIGFCICIGFWFANMIYVIFDI